MLYVYIYIYISIILGVPRLSPEVWVATLVLVLFIISIITETCKFVQRICGAARFEIILKRFFGALKVSSNNSHCMDCIDTIYIYGNSPKKWKYKIQINSDELLVLYIFFGLLCIHISQEKTKQLRVSDRIQVLDLAPFGPPLGWQIFPWETPRI